MNYPVGNKKKNKIDYGIYDRSCGSKKSVILINFYKIENIIPEMKKNK
jgi:hypothetical protein